MHEAVHNSFIINDDCNESIITVNVKSSFAQLRPSPAKAFQASRKLFAQIRSENNFRKKSGSEGGSRFSFQDRLQGNRFIFVA